MKDSVVFSNSINLGGLYSPRPIRLQWNKSLNSWWDKEGNYEATKLGVFEEDGLVQFTSLDRQEVEFWTLGVKATMKMLKRWVR